MYNLSMTNACIYKLCCTWLRQFSLSCKLFALATVLFLFSIKLAPLQGGR